MRTPEALQRNVLLIKELNANVQRIVVAYQQLAGALAGGALAGGGDGAAAAAAGPLRVSANAAKQPPIVAVLAPSVSSAVIGSSGALRAALGTRLGLASRLQAQCAPWAPPMALPPSSAIGPPPTLTEAAAPEHAAPSAPAAAAAAAAGDGAARLGVPLGPDDACQDEQRRWLLQLPGRGKDCAQLRLAAEREFDGLLAEVRDQQRKLMGQLAARRQPCPERDAEVPGLLAGWEPRLKAARLEQPPAGAAGAAPDAKSSPLPRVALGGASGPGGALSQPLPALAANAVGLEQQLPLRRPPRSLPRRSLSMRAPGRPAPPPDAGAATAAAALASAASAAAGMAAAVAAAGEGVADATLLELIDVLLEVDLLASLAPSPALVTGGDAWAPGPALAAPGLHASPSERGAAVAVAGGAGAHARPPCADDAPPSFSSWLQQHPRCSAAGSASFSDWLLPAVEQLRAAPAPAAPRVPVGTDARDHQRQRPALRHHQQVRECLTHAAARCKTVAALAGQLAHQLAGGGGARDAAASHGADATARRELGRPRPRPRAGGAPETPRAAAGALGSDTSLGSCSPEQQRGGGVELLAGALEWASFAV
ncbi:hypothetical protein HT031_001430 [Scenedesmus sp. PABB004]|nr:hypothetical protein HT031_001430 [Scenedesmus sp. PABB004]